MTDEIKRISIKEFREIGFLQEVNRQFFHPLGLALEVSINEDGIEYLSGVWDYREDPEGITFGGGMIEAEKAKNVLELKMSKEAARVASLGYSVQEK